MTDSGDAACVPGSGTGLSFTAGRGLPGRVRSLSSPAQPGRLTSLRTRDLTLGGVFKKTKKTFEPNVHAVRKSKDELKEEIHSAPKKERRQREERRRENRGRRRERPQTIQSHSIFEQGPADTVRKTGAQLLLLLSFPFLISFEHAHQRSVTEALQVHFLPCLCSGWRGATDLQDSTTSPVCKLVKKERKDSEEEDDEILNKLQRDDFIDDPGLRNDVRLKPIQLPLCHTLTASTACPENPPPFRPSGHSRTERPKPEQPSVVELLQDLSLSGREELFFMQLPDSMPGRESAQKVDPSLGSSAEKAASKEGKPEDKRPAHLQAHEAAAKEGCPVLSQLPEGFLGKLQIRKSGKVELKLGHIVMDVSEGAAFSFLQQLVSVRLSDGRTGDMMVLGNVHHKLVLSPDFQALLRQAAAQQQGP
ncbi:DNA-directed RNA polymerase III subunit RPC4 isoform X2 [Anarrhichthys ocellatus]|uniref:DNA-directed RNA polymerase III subunit RPC4 isoform X2 n=1 Tax=Anarrhichthys ocellatus TaxID=433405 RepID=UPI0012EE8EF5|nr:DNA-directed RNA polymerase III subunit RPC4-like isoform X2 [Anarrhichthys ocellatus]